MPKRGTDHTWQLIKFKGDSAIYARCKCKHYYNCGRPVRDDNGCLIPFRQVPTIFYPYCPICGARKKRRTVEIEKLDRYEFE